MSKGYMTVCLSSHVYEMIAVIWVHCKEKIIEIYLILNYAQNAQKVHSYSFNA